MMRWFSMIVVGLLLQGCWIRLPSRGPDAVRSHVGKTGTINEPLYICKDWDGMSSLTGDELSRADPNSLIAVLHPGTKVKVVSIVSRRLPPGLAYYYVLQPTAPDSRLRFDHFCGTVPIHQPYPNLTITFDE